jgi:hypothetical protein
MRYFIFTVWVALLLNTIQAAGGQSDIFVTETESRYRIGVQSTADIAKQVAVFIAKRKAVDKAGCYFAAKSLIPDYKKNKEEIYCLTARMIDAKILEKDQQTDYGEPAYHVRIRAWVKPSDFIMAASEDAKEVQNEQNESFQEEMEQPVSAQIDPGKDMAKAYRLLREKKWRIAMIYLHHLERKYPYWASLYMAKAVTHLHLNELELRQKALDDACRLGHQIACEEISK